MMEMVKRHLPFLFPKDRLSRWLVWIGLAHLLVALVALSWFFLKWSQARRQQAAVQATKALGWSVVYDYQLNAQGKLIPRPVMPGPEWLRNLLGDDFFRNVVAIHSGEHVYVQGPPLPVEPMLRQAAAFPELRELDLSPANVTDADLEQLKGLGRLRKLNLRGPQTPEYTAKLQRALPKCAVSWDDWIDLIGPTSPAPPLGTCVAASLTRDGQTYPLSPDEITCVEKLLLKRRQLAEPRRKGTMVTPLPTDNEIILWRRQGDSLVEEDVIQVDDFVGILHSKNFGNRATFQINYETGEVTWDEDRQPLLDLIRRIWEETEEAGATESSEE